MSNEKEELVTAPESTDTAEEQTPDLPAEDAPSDNKQKKPAHRRIRLRPVMAAVTVLFAALAGAAAWGVMTLRGKQHECEMTKLPTGLSAVDTVKQYFEYWDAGNNEGMNQAALPDENMDPTTVSESFDAGSCWFCDVKLVRAEQLSLLAEGFEGCYESAIVSVDFTYERHLGFGDENIPEINNNWEFYLAKINKGDDFKIISVRRG